MLRKLLLFLILILSFQAVSYSSERYNITYEKGIYHILIPYNEHSNKINFCLTEKLMTNKQFHKQSGADFTINTGFFDPVNEKTISFIYTDGILTESPLFNENIINNHELMDNWNKIANRAEFRVIKSEDGKFIYDIVEHDAQYEGELITSAQGGPMLLPQMDLEKEFFIVKDSSGKVVRESASVLHKTARTIIGLKNSDVHIFIVTDRRPMTIYQAQDLCKSYGLDKAMAFDGGSSTSFNYKKKINVVSTGIKGDATGRKLKSFMIFK